MKYLSVCSGIEAASVAWKDLGWEAVGFSEIDAFPSAVLKHHFPEVPNYGDMQEFQSWPIERGSIDILVGGTPCQSFSVAGLRGGLSDSRGNLALTYLRLADHYRPRWIVWENVPGVLSSGAGRDFGTFLGGLAHIGYQFSWRVLDAQHFGVPQRRRRIFVVGHSRDWRSAAEVLFEPEGVRGDFAKGRKAREKTPVGSTRRAESGVLDPVGTLCSDTHPGAYSGQDAYSGRIVPDAGGGLVATLALIKSRRDEQAGLQNGNFDYHRGIFDLPMTQYGSIANTLTSRHDSSPCSDRGKKSGRPPSVAGLGVRRLTPVECERLQGFPDNWTLVPFRGKTAADSPRYKAIGNSMAVPVMKWIGERINQVEKNRVQKSMP